MAKATSAGVSTPRNVNVNPLGFLKKATFYPVEYIVMLSLGFSSLISLSLLGASLIGSWLGESLPFFADMGVIYIAASLVVTLSLHLALYWRVRHYDQPVTQLSQRVVNGFLGFYLLLAISVEISLITGLLYLVFDALFGVRDRDTGYWVAILTLLQAIAWFKYFILHFLRVRAGVARARYYILTTGLLGLAIVLAALLLPGGAAKSAAHDRQAEQDLTTISSSISDYYQAENKLPASLSDLSLSGSVAKRLGNYEYRAKSGGLYEICATFKNDAGAAYGYQDFGFGFGSHSKGRQCFTRNASGYGYYDPLQVEGSGYLDDASIQPAGASGQTINVD
jgi:hypothetical protein